MLSTAAPVKRPSRNAWSASFACASGNTVTSGSTPSRAASGRNSRPSSRVRFATERMLRSSQSLS